MNDQSQRKAFGKFIVSVKSRRSSARAATLAVEVRTLEQTVSSGLVRATSTCASRVRLQPSRRCCRGGLAPRHGTSVQSWGAAMPYRRRDCLASAQIALRAW